MTSAPRADVDAVQNPAEINAVFAKLAREPDTSLLMVPDIWLAANREQVVDLAAKYRVPAVYDSRLDSTGRGFDVV
jgi:putative ABC transport system substrate-binding protein